MDVKNETIKKFQKLIDSPAKQMFPRTQPCTLVSEDSSLSELGSSTLFELNPSFHLTLNSVSAVRHTSCWAGYFCHNFHLSIWRPALCVTRPLCLLFFHSWSNTVSHVLGRHPSGLAGAQRVMPQLLELSYMNRGHKQPDYMIKAMTSNKPQHAYNTNPSTSLKKPVTDLNDK